MTIRWTLPATQDLKSIADYITERSGEERAYGVIRSIYSAVQSLEQMPYRGRLGRTAGTRELVLTNLPFLVVSRVYDNHVEILRIVHGARQWP